MQRGMKLARRTVVVGGAAAALSSSAAQSFEKQLEALERKLGGNLGLFAVRGTQELTWRPDDRFAYCSVFKWVLAAAVLRATQEKRLSLTQAVPFTEKELFEPCDFVRAHLAEGKLSVAELCAATTRESDNAAAGLLETLVGGPAGLRAFTELEGDTTTRFDRVEPELNTNLPGDPRDTSTARAMTLLLRQCLEGDVLDADSKAQLFAWMKAAQTGLTRIRAAVPKAWDAGDKTGTSGNGAVNDVAVLRPPKGAPLYVSIFVNSPRNDTKASAAAIAEAARLVIARLG
jgi:beta-lactamase class A